MSLSQVDSRLGMRRLTAVKGCSTSVVLALIRIVVLYALLASCEAHEGYSGLTSELIIGNTTTGDYIQPCVPLPC